MSDSGDPTSRELTESRQLEIELPEGATGVPVDSSRKVAPAWKTASLFLGSLAALLTALGPLTAWINGKEQRALQESQASADLSLRYMDLILRQSKDLAERRVTLKFLEEALVAQDPKEVMLRVVRKELDSIESADALKKALSESRGRVSDLEEELQTSRLREANLLAEQDLSLATGEENIKLKAQLDQERERRQQHEVELKAAMDKVLQLQGRLREQQSTAVINVPNEVPTPFERSLENLNIPERESTILRRLHSVCVGHDGTGSIVYFGPSQPGISCSINGEVVMLTKAALKVTRAPSNSPFGRGQAPPGSPSWAFTVCSGVGGELVSNPMAWDEALCKLEDGTGVRVGSW